MEDGTSGTTHDLLLALAGRVDDDLLGWTRELVAVGEDAHAVELLTATLVAGRAVLPQHVRTAVVVAARSARIDLDAARALLAPRPEDGTEHRFVPPADDDPVAAALHALPSRPLVGCRVYLARRITPAGSAPGPLPHPVVVVQVRRGAPPADVLAYQLAAALERAGTPASVEVLAEGWEVSAYHAAALENAAAVRTEGSDERPPAPSHAEPPFPEPDERAEAPWSAAYRLVEPPPRSGESDPDPLDDEPTVVVALRQHAREPSIVQFEDVATVRLDADALGVARAERADEEQQPEASWEPDEAPHPPPEPPSPRPLALPSPMSVRDEPPSRPVPRPTPMPTATDGIRRPNVTPISRPAVPSPIPLTRRNGPPPVARPLGPVPPPVPARPREAEQPGDGDAGPHEPRGEWPAEPRVETSEFETLSDPLNGPLNEPLLDPLLDPTMHEEDPLEVGERPRENSEGQAPDDENAGEEQPRGDADGGPTDAIDDEWSAEWRTGRWAMAPSALEERDEPPGREGGPLEEHPAPRPSPRRAARHRYVEEARDPQPTDDEAAKEPATGEAPEPAAVAPEQPQPEYVQPEQPQPEYVQPEPARAAEQPEFGLRPESVARLSDADRQLLARLQAELVDSRRARNGRRPGHPGTNGVPRAAPPDLAG